MSEWYLSRDGQQEGPMTAPQIGALLAHGLFKANEAYVWKEGMADWKTIAESGILAESAMAQARPAGVAASPAPLQTASSLNPYATPATTSDAAAFDPGYPGIGRLAYFLWHIGLGVIVYGVLFLVAAAKGGTASLDGYVGGSLLVSSILGVGSLYLGLKRVRNLGMSGWAILWTFVPIISLWISWRMFACPAGYDDHRQLDLAGKILTGLVVGTFLLAIVASFMAP